MSGELLTIEGLQRTLDAHRAAIAKAGHKTVLVSLETLMDMTPEQVDKVAPYIDSNDPNLTVKLSSAAPKGKMIVMDDDWKTPLSWARLPSIGKV